jgi:hypothetical protein
MNFVHLFLLFLVITGFDTLLAKLSEKIGQYSNDV